MRKIVNRRIRRQGRSASLVADVNAVISGNVGESGGGSGGGGGAAPGPCTLSAAI